MCKEISKINEEVLNEDLIASKWEQQFGSLEEDSILSAEEFLKQRNEMKEFAKKYYGR